MIEQNESGWYVINVRDANWSGVPQFGKVCSFEREGRFPQTGIHLFLLEPGKPNCRYHREDAQEDLLVLSGECLLLVNGEERKLGPWDFAHLPAGTTHVTVGAGDGPCAVLIIGHRPAQPRLYYPESELARRFGAEAPEPTDDPKVAYSDVPPRGKVEAPAWPIG